MILVSTKAETQQQHFQPCQRQDPCQLPMARHLLLHQLQGSVLFSCPTGLKGEPDRHTQGVNN